MDKIKQEGYCNTCWAPQEDKYYVFCGTECSDIWIWVKEKNMGQYDIDMEVYKGWLEGTVKTIDAMTTREEIEARIGEIAKIEFLARREWALLNQHWAKLSGRNSIAPWLKAERDALITDPTIKVNWEAEPRKKAKRDKVSAADLLGIDFDAEMKKLKKEVKDKDAPAVKKKPMDMTSLLQSLATVKAKEAKPEISQEEKDAKLAEMREKIRLAKEKKG